jgi:GntR family transcriptional regulator, trigonelline degradation regulator
MAADDGRLKRLELPLPVQHATAQIRDAIVAGRIRPGGRLVEQDLARELGLPRGLFRDALRQLGQEGLVVIRPNRGAIVRSVAAEDVIEVYALRAVLGSLALRHLLGSGRMTEALFGELEAAAEQARFAADQAALVEADLAFQSLIAEWSGLPRVAARFAELTTEIRMFITILGIQYGDVDEILREHATLIEAIRAGDLDRAEALWHARFTRAQREFLELLPEGPAALLRLPRLALDADTPDRPRR